MGHCLRLYSLWYINHVVRVRSPLTTDGGQHAIEVMATPVNLPPSLLYPVEIVALEVFPGSSVERHQNLVRFKYWNRVPDGVPEEGEEPELVNKEFYGNFESPYDGKITSIEVKVGDRINDSLTPVFKLEEICDHSVQYGGLCALCGRSLDNKDYMEYSDVDRAPIAMSHDTSGLTVSLTEAERIETRSTQRLLKEKRLILVVDLDQTVIHAAVNPDIGQWMDDPNSVHHDQVKDVRSFSLKERVGAHEQTCWYYVKLRPGLDEFLRAMAPKYEMHVYTMATRQYALEIAKIIDPKGEFFSDRILSRDASGSLLHKDLKRLFPVSTRMVTIIDDRGDVWNWIPNLVRVVPYHFWSNTGDINSQYLPKRSGLVTPDQIEDSDDKIASQNNDSELRSVGKALEALHQEFYDLYNPQTELPNVGKILPALKSEVFDGCVILFSGFFPLGTTDLDSADIVQWVRSFGAIVLADYLPSVTHVVARNAGTMKARQAAGQRKMVVGIEWIFECLEQWRHVDEDRYLLDVPNPIAAKSAASEEVSEQDGELDPNIADGFMRSIKRGDVDWDDIDEELKELYDSDEDEEESELAENGKNADGEIEQSAVDKQEEKTQDEAKNGEANGYIHEEGDRESKKRKRETESDSDDLGLDEDWD